MKITEFKKTYMYMCCKECGYEVTHCNKCERLIKSYDDLYCAKFEVHNCVYCIEG